MFFSRSPPLPPSNHPEMLMQFERNNRTSLHSSTRYPDGASVSKKQWNVGKSEREREREGDPTLSLTLIITLISLSLSLNIALRFWSDLEQIKLITIPPLSLSFCISYFLLFSSCYHSFILSFLLFHQAIFPLFLMLTLLSLSLFTFPVYFPLFPRLSLSLFRSIYLLFISTFSLSLTRSFLLNPTEWNRMKK